MATIGNLVNAGQRGDTQDPSAFSVLADIIYKRGEEQRQVEIEKQSKMAKLQSIAAQRLTPNSSRGIDKIGYMTNNPDQYGLKVKSYDKDLNPTGYEVIEQDEDLPELQKTTAAKGGRIFQNREEQLAELARVSNEKAAEETPTEKRARVKDLNEATTTLTSNQSSRQKIADVLGRIDNVPSGRFGAMNIDWMKNFDPNNPKLSDWQAIKSVLTDTTLLKSMQTKGAISDSEMTEFRKAAANDDLISPARIKEALSDYVRKLDAEDEGLSRAYKLSWGQDPREMISELGTQANGMPTPEEAAQKAAEGYIGYDTEKRQWVR